MQALSYAGEIDRANALAAKWLDRDRLDPQALGYQADLLGRDGKREQALRLLAGVVDLDADRAAPHERMVQAYEHVGRMSQACSHRIALSAIAPKDGKAAAAAVRCLRALSREADAQIVMHGLADDATRAATDKALLTPDVAPKAGGDVVIDARWDGNEDLDISVVTPDGTRVSWMGGRPDVRVTDATSTQKEQLALRSIKRGNYLVEITRGGMTAGTAPVRGTLDIVALGTKKSLPFEITGAHKTVGRLSINLQEHVETIDTSAAVAVQFGTISSEAARRVMYARSGDIQRCFDGTRSGRMVLTITVGAGGQTTTQAAGGNQTENQCVSAALNYMHVEGTPAGVMRVPLTWRAQYSND